MIDETTGKGGETDSEDDQEDDPGQDEHRLRLETRSVRLSF